MEIGEVFGDIIITERKYKKKKRVKKGSNPYNENQKWYKYKCNKCGWEDGWIIESDLLGGTGCSCCANRTAVLGINTIWDTDRWLCDLGVSEEDAKTHTRSSGKKVIITCPDCGKQKEMALCNVYMYQSIGCTCGDGFSYGHKYVHSVLKQNNIDFQNNVTFDWCKFKDYKEDKTRSGEYDFVIEDIKVIVEVDGGFHRKDNKMSGQTKEESQYIDEMKDKLAKEHGYEIIRIYYDDKYTIKPNILKSDIVNIININNVNWLKCEEFALNNRVKPICEYWNNKEDWETTKDLAEIFGLCKDTISSYLKKGTELGWCNYNPKEELRKSASIRHKKNCKRVAVFKDGKPYLLKNKENNIFTSCVELAELSKDLDNFNAVFTQQGISSVCRGEQRLHRGFTFEYV